MDQAWTGSSENSTMCRRRRFLVGLCMVEGPSTWVIHVSLITMIFDHSAYIYYSPLTEN